MESRSVEDPAKRTNVTYQLRMDPKLEEEDKLRMDQKLRGRNNQRSRKVEPVSQLEKSLENWLAEGGGQVEFFTAMMDLVDRPEQSYLMACSMEPVVAKIYQDSRSHPGNWRVPRKIQDTVVLMDIRVDTEDETMGEHPHHGHDQSRGDAGDTVSNIVLLPQPPVDHGL